MGPTKIWDHLPRSVQQQIIDKQLRFFVIDASQGRARRRARRAHQHRAADLLLRISGVLPRDEAIRHIKQSISKTYGDKGAEVVRTNFAAVDDTLAHLYEVTVPAAATSAFERPPIVPADAPDVRARGHRA